MKKKIVRDESSRLLDRQTARSFRVETLEDRLLFSAAAHAALPQITPQYRSLALIDGLLPDQSLIAASLPPGTESIVYNPDTESASQILTQATDAALKDGGQLSSILVFSHGSAGSFGLGDNVVSQSTLSQTASQWKALGSLMAQGGSIDLFACNLAASVQGKALLQSLHTVTGANVFGSTNITGHDGDWTLEQENGDATSVSVSPLGSEIQSYSGDLTTDVVANTSNTGAGSLRNTIAAATAGDTIDLTGVSGTITLATAITISQNLTITGPGASALAISGNNASQMFIVNSGVTLNISGLKFTNGLGSSGGAILNNGTLVVSNSWFTGNNASSAGGVAVGGAIFTNSGASSLTITDCTFDNNSVINTGVGALGGAVGSEGSGTATITDSTFNNNFVRGTSSAYGGALYLQDATDVLFNCTVVGNSSELGGTNTTGTAGGIYFGGSSSTITNTIVALNLGTTPDISKDVPLTSGGFNIIGVNPGGGVFTNGTNGDQTGTAGTPLNPLVSAEASNGGSTPTMALQSTSPAINAGTSTGAPAQDQRGDARDGAVDIGAYEYQGATLVTAAAASPSTVTGTTSALSVLGADGAGEGTLTYTWAATTKPSGATPTFSANGTNGAKASTVTFNKFGSYSFTVTISDGSTTTTSVVAVTVNQTLTAIVVTPSAPALNENGTQQFSAVANDQFGIAMASQPSFTWTKTAGTGTVSVGGLYTAPGAPATATVNAASGGINGTASVTVTNGAPTVATAAAANLSTVTGTTTALSVLGADDGGESNLTYTWAATTKPNLSTPTFSANGTNDAKASTVTFNQFGAYTFTVTISDGSLSTTSVVAVTVNQTLTAIVVTPSTAPLNENATQQFAAVANDQFGIALVSQPTFTWTRTAGTGTVSVGGLYTAPGAPATATVNAASGGVNGTASVTVTNAAPTVATAAAATPSPVTGTTTALSVLGADDGGEANLTYTWAATAKPNGSTPTFSANGTNAAKASTVTFNQWGAYSFTVTISDGSLSTTSVVAVTVNQTLTAIVVTPSTPAISENATQQFAAVANDQFGIALVSQPSFTWTKTAGTGTVSVGGLYTAPGAPATATVNAASGGVNGTASVNVNNGSPTVATAAAASPSTVTATTAALSVLGADDGGEPNLTYTWAATTKPSGATPTFSANGTNAAKASTVTFDKFGSYSFTVTISDGSTTTTSVVPVTVNQTMTAIVVTPSTAPLNQNATQQFVATANDQFGVALVTQPTFTWTKTAGTGTVSVGGLYTAPGAPATATVNAASGGINGTASVTVTNGAPTVATAAAANLSTVTGTTTALSVLGADDGGEANLTYTWAATTKPNLSTVTFSANGTNAAKASTATFNQSGAYSFTVTISDGTLTTTSVVAVTVNQTVTTIVVTPSSAPLNENGTQQFSAVASDQFGIAFITPPTFTWTKTAGNGAVSATGLYTAPGAPATATVNAASGGINGTASVTVTDTAPAVDIAAAATPSPVTGMTTALSVLAASDGGEPNLTYTWAATTKPNGSTPTFSANGTNASKASTVTFNKFGSYSFTVTISDGTLSTTSVVAVTVNQTLTAIVVSPSTSPLGENATQQFTAVANDQFGVALVSQPSFTWTKTAGTGTVSVGGLYTAPGAPATATVNAASGGINGTASATVTNAAPTVATAAAASPSTVTATTAALSVLGADDGGESNLTYTWSATTKPSGATPMFSANGTNAAKASTVTFNKAGSYSFTVTISDGTLSTTSVVAVTVNQTYTSIAVTPSPAPLGENANQQFVATADDQFGVALVTQPTFTWTKTAGTGSINSIGLYTGPAVPGTATVNAASGGMNGTSSITVTNMAPTVATAASATPSPVTGTTTALSVLGADDGGEANLTYTWSATTSPNGSNPVLSINATNASKNTTVTFDEAGSYTFRVGISDGTNTTYSSVTFTVNAPVTTSSITSATAAEITGYSYNPANKTAPNKIEIDIQNGPEVPQTILANLPSPELLATVGATSNDFAYTMPVLSVGAHMVSIYSITASNAKTLIGTETITSQNSLFDEHYYLMENPDVAAAVRAGTFATGYDNYVQYGQFEGRNPSPYWDEAYYLKENPDVAAAVQAKTVTSGFMHFYMYGQHENRPGTLYYNNTYYLQNNTDVAAAVTSGGVTSGFEHFVLYGQYEGRSPMQYFSNTMYKADNQDILSSVTGETYSSAFEHFVMYGQYEDRIASSSFNEQAYLANNADVAAAVTNGSFSDGFQHWLEFGQYEGRRAV